METDGVTRLFIDGGSAPNSWVQEIYPQDENTSRHEGDDDTAVRLRLQAICSDEGQRWSVHQVAASAYIVSSFSIDKSGDEQDTQYPALVEALEQRLGATGLTVLVTK